MVSKSDLSIWHALTAILFISSMSLGYLAYDSNAVIDQKNDKISELNSHVEELEDNISEQRTRAIVHSDSPTWGQESIGSSKYEFAIGMYNGGESEARNVTLTCGVFDSNEQLQYDFKYNVGNVASQTFTYESFSEKIQDVTAEATASCIVTSCEDCIKVNNRIDEFTELFGSKID